MTNVDTEIFKFVGRLIEKGVEKKQAPEKVNTMKGLETIIDLGEVKDLKITHFDEDDDSIKTRFASVKQKMVGLSVRDFSDFKAMILQLLDIEPYQSTCTIDFLLDRSFDWLISVYESQKADSSLTAFLLDSIEKESDFHQFYFKLEALAIEKEIKIGDVLITFFEEDEIKRLYTDFVITKPEMSFTDFTKLYNGLFKINAHIKVKGILDRTEEVAKNRIELAVDILKIYCIPYCLDSKIQMFDLDYRIHRGSRACFINIPRGEIKRSSILLRNFSGIVPIQLDSNTIDRFVRKGLRTFSDFAISKTDNDLHLVIVRMISQLSEITSTFSNYDKLVKAISLSESILLPQPSTGKAKGLTRLKTALPKIISNEPDQAPILNSLADLYATRDAYLHNRVLRPISKTSLFYFLDFQRVLILKMIEISRSSSTLQEAQSYLGIT